MLRESTDITGEVDVLTLQDAQSWETDCWEAAQSFSHANGLTSLFLQKAS